MLAGAHPALNLARMLDIDTQTDIEAALPATDTLSEPKELPILRPMTVIAREAVVCMDELVVPLAEGEE